MKTSNKYPTFRCIRFLEGVRYMMLHTYKTYKTKITSIHIENNKKMYLLLIPIFKILSLRLGFKLVGRPNIPTPARYVQAQRTTNYFPDLLGHFSTNRPTKGRFNTTPS